MEYFKVDGREWNVRVLDMEESFNILYGENTGRTIADGAPMVLDPLGTFFGHKITIAAQKGNEAEYDELLEYLATPRYKGVLLEAAHGQDTISYQAYVSNGARAVRRIDAKGGKVYWGSLDLNFVAMKARYTP